MPKAADETRVLSAVTVSDSIIFFYGMPSFMGKCGYRVAISSSPGPELDQIIRNENAIGFPVPMKREPSPWKDLVSLFRIFGVIREFKPTIVNAGTPKAGFLFILASWIMRTPFRVYHLRGLRHESMGGIAAQLQIVIERFTGMMSTHVVCETDSLRQLALCQGLFKPHKCFVLGPGSSGVELENFQPDHFSTDDKIEFRKELGIPENAMVIGFLGRLIPRKGVPELLVAWQSLKNMYPDAHLLLVGPEEPAQPLDPATLQHIQRDPRVISVGKQSETAKFYSIMDVFTLPAHWEGFGNVVVEAAAMGLPVVTTTGPGTRDAAKDGFNALLIAPKSSEELTLALSSYCESFNLRKQHGANGKSWAKRFDRNTILADLRNFYDGLNTSS